MDSVAFDFCERVLVTRKCCKLARCYCRKALFAAPKWNQTQVNVLLYFGCTVANGQWRYAFRNSTQFYDTLTMDELAQFPNLRNVRISWIEFVEATQSETNEIEGVEKFLNFVSFLSNEPQLRLRKNGLSFGSNQGRAVLEWLETRWFSHIWIQALRPIYHKILENQFSRREPTHIELIEINGSVEFLQRHLMSGDLRWITISVSSYEFPSTVLAQIVCNVFEEEEHCKKKLKIVARFDDLAKRLMDSMAERKLCAVDAGGLNYKFKKQSSIFNVSKFDDGVWTIFLR